MASCSSPEQFQCSVCLEAFTEPVSTPCGHNFCKACISNYWDSTHRYQCPLCKEKFKRRPELRVNTAFRDLVVNVKKRKVRDDEDSARPGEVACDVCTGTKLKALKSCLRCLTSYCETHLEPHLRVPALKKHQLVDPMENLEDRMCKKHDKLLELFCREDETCVCVMCMHTDHKTHNAVPLEEECRQRKDKLGKMTADIDQMMKTRSVKVQQIKRSVKISKRKAERERSDSVKVCTALVSSIRRSEAELIQMIDETQKATEKQAQGFIKELQLEIAELKRRRSVLSQSEDHLHLLQSFTFASTPLQFQDWSQIGVHSDLSVVGDARRAVSQLEDTLITEMKKLADVKLKMIQQYAVDVHLDPGTAHPFLVLSEDGKQVEHGDTWRTLPDNPERFNGYESVLGKESFSSGRFYYEVQVGGKTGWDLGVVKESIDRKWFSHLDSDDGYWTISLRSGDEYWAFGDRDVRLSLRGKPQKVGVFVSYEEGCVSFYDVGTGCHIYTYTGCNFTEKIYPFFTPRLNEDGKNSLPLIVTPVTHTA